MSGLLISPNMEKLPDPEGWGHEGWGQGWGQACNIGISKTLRLNSTILRPNSTSFWDRMRKCLAAALNVEMSRLTRLLNSVSVNFPDSNTNQATIPRTSEATRLLPAAESSPSSTPQWPPILKHLGLWLVKARPTPKAHAPPAGYLRDPFSQLSMNDDHLYRDPDYPPNPR